MSELRCTACGVEAEAKCTCGKPYDYVPAHKAAALGVAAHPDWSDRKIAEMVGVSHHTIAAARNSTGQNCPVEKRLGKDGKSRRTHKPKRDLTERDQRIIADAKAGMSAKDISLKEGIVERGVNRILKEDHIRGAAFAAGQREPIVNYDDLTPAQKKRVDAYERRLYAGFEETVLREIKRRVDELVEPRFAERERDAERCRKASRQRGVFEREEYNVILRCVHPDRMPSIDEKNEAFRLLHENRLLLLSEKDDPRSYPPIPTAAEFMAGIKRPFKRA